MEADPAAVREWDPGEVPEWADPADGDPADRLPRRPDAAGDGGAEADACPDV